MGFMKRVATLVMAGVLAASTLSVAAASSPTKTQIKSATNVTVTYKKSAQKPSPVVKDANGNVLKEGTDYVVTGESQKEVGTYKYTVEGIGKYSGTKTITFTIKRASRNLKVTPSKKTVKNTKKRTVQLKSTYERYTAPLHYKVTKAPKGGKKYISISKKGKVTIKKGAKKGTYKIKVYVVKSGCYNAASKTVTIKVK